MSNPQPPKPSRPPGSIDFELTDFDDARQAMNELPAGVAEVQHMRPKFWEDQRRKSTPTDRALTGSAIDWIIGLPPGLRPHLTCEQFPRVINAIAGSWSDVAYSLQVLDHMIRDYRGGRRGFPTSVQRELAALHAHQSARSGR